MKSLALSQFAHINLTAIGLIIFLTFFAGVLIWTSLKENKKAYKLIQNIPFEDGESYE